MGKYSVYMCGIAAFLMYVLSHKYLMVISIVAMIANFWSLGVMHNYAVLAARKNGHRMRNFTDFTPEEADQAPDLATGINLGSSVVGFGLLVTGLFMIFF